MPRCTHLSRNGSHGPGNGFPNEDRQSTPFARAASARFEGDPGQGVGSVRQQGIDPGSGNQLDQQIEPLRHQLADEVAEAGEIAAGPGEIRD